MSIDVRTLSAQRLEALIRTAKKEKARKANRKPLASVRKQVEKLVRASGYSLSELFDIGNRASSGGRPTPKASAKTPKPAKRAVAPKYRNPSDATQTWSGRGNQPRWLAAALKEGATLDSFRIEAPSA